MLATETASTPHLRVSAVKSNESKTDGPQQSSRVAPPPSIVEDQFFWTYTEEPHRSRRQAIIKAHPEVGRTTIVAFPPSPVDWTGLDLPLSLSDRLLSPMFALSVYLL